MNEGSVLMSDENPQGWKLEELLVKLQNELKIKSEKIKSSGHESAEKISKNNEKVIQLLQYAHAIQTDTLKELGHDVPDSPFLNTGYDNHGTQTL